MYLFYLRPPRKWHKTVKIAFQLCSVSYNDQNKDQFYIKIDSESRAKTYGRAKYYRHLNKNAWFPYGHAFGNFQGKIFLPPITFCFVVLINSAYWLDFVSTFPDLAQILTEFAHISPIFARICSNLKASKKAEDKKVVSNVFARICSNFCPNFYFCPVSYGNVYCHSILTTYNHFLEHKSLIS